MPLCGVHIVHPCYIEDMKHHLKVTELKLSIGPEQINSFWAVEEIFLLMQSFAFECFDSWSVLLMYSYRSSWMRLVCGCCSSSRCPYSQHSPLGCNPPLSSPTLISSVSSLGGNITKSEQREVRQNEKLWIPLNKWTICVNFMTMHYHGTLHLWALHKLQQSVVISDMKIGPWPKFTLSTKWCLSMFSGCLLNMITTFLSRTQQRFTIIEIWVFEKGDILNEALTLYGL